ncbi:hypothetical protein Dda_1595 [Drechslerella dactyloides]|uniref:Uncharacterized protein n=1 Tax=Drechslerella dactyloides TaxID=74499 RepID=A0AAD6NKS2_DREDA|nr:hypothetical protein Dda_1595 [Drechslerella dactyloides]
MSSGSFKNNFSFPPTPPNMRFENSESGGGPLGGEFPAGSSHKKGRIAKCVKFVKKSAIKLAAPAAFVVKAMSRKGGQARERPAGAARGRETSSLLLLARKHLVLRKAKRRIGRQRAEELAGGLAGHRRWELPGAGGRFRNPLHPEGRKRKAARQERQRAGPGVIEWTEEMSRAFAFDMPKAQKMAREIEEELEDELPHRQWEEMGWDEILQEFFFYRSVSKFQAVTGTKVDAPMFFAMRTAALKRAALQRAPEDSSDGSDGHPASAGPSGPSRWSPLAARVSRVTGGKDDEDDDSKNGDGGEARGSGDGDAVSPVGTAVRPAGAVACGGESFLPARLTVPVGRQRCSTVENYDGDRWPSKMGKGLSADGDDSLFPQGPPVPSLASVGDGRASLLNIQEALKHVHPQQSQDGRGGSGTGLRVGRTSHAGDVERLIGTIPDLQMQEDLVRALQARGVELGPQLTQGLSLHEAEAKKKADKRNSLGLMWAWGEKLREVHGTDVQMSPEETSTFVDRLRVGARWRGKKAGKQREASSQQLPPEPATMPQLQEEEEENRLHLTISNPEDAGMTLYEMLAEGHEEDVAEVADEATQGVQEVSQRREEGSRQADRQTGEVKEKLAQYYEAVQLDHEKAGELVEKYQGMHPADIFAPDALKGIVRRKSIDPIVISGEKFTKNFQNLAGNRRSDPEVRRWWRYKQRIQQQHIMRQHYLRRQRIAQRQAEEQGLDASKSSPNLGGATDIPAKAADNPGESSEAPPQAAPAAAAPTIIPAPYNPEIGGSGIKLPSLGLFGGKGLLATIGRPKGFTEWDHVHADSMMELPDIAEIQQMRVPEGLEHVEDPGFADNEGDDSQSPEDSSDYMFPNGPYGDLDDEGEYEYVEPVIDLSVLDASHKKAGHLSWIEREEDPDWQMLKGILGDDDLEPEQLIGYDLLGHVKRQFGAKFDDAEIEEFVSKVSRYIPQDEVEDSEASSAEQPSAEDRESGTLSQVATRTNSDYQESNLTPSFDPDTTVPSSFEESANPQLINEAPQGNEQPASEPRISTALDSPASPSSLGSPLSSPTLDSHANGDIPAEDAYMHPVSHNLLREQAAIANQRITEDSIFARTNITRRPKIRPEIEAHRQRVMQATATRVATSEVPLGWGLRSQSRGKPRVLTGKELRPLRCATLQSPTAWYGRSGGDDSDEGSSSSRRSN